MLWPACVAVTGSRQTVTLSHNTERVDNYESGDFQCPQLPKGRTLAREGTTAEQAACLGDTTGAVSTERELTWTCGTIRGLRKAFVGIYFGQPPLTKVINYGSDRKVYVVPEAVPRTSVFHR